MIPKIIHQLMPLDDNKWHPLWKPCSESWKDKFPGFAFMHWDEDKIIQFINDFYPQYLKLYISFPIHIMRIDFARYCILHKYGGIYADMDIYCYENFYHHLTEYNLFLAQSINPPAQVENSLMVAEPNLDFFSDCMESSEITFNLNKEINIQSLKDNKAIYTAYVSSITGINLLSNVYDYFKSNDSVKIGLLDFDCFLGDRTKYSPKMITRHMCTDSWGGYDREQLQVDFDFYK